MDVSFHFQINNLFVGFALPCYLHCLRLAFVILLIWKWNHSLPPIACLALPSIPAPVKFSGRSMQNSSMRVASPAISSAAGSTIGSFTSLRSGFHYPEHAIEAEIVAHKTGVQEDVAEKPVSIAERARNLKGHGLDEVISTRMLIYAGSLIAKGGDAHAACRVA